jgi:hypothetical protein
MTKGVFNPLFNSINEKKKYVSYMFKERMSLFKSLN